MGWCDNQVVRGVIGVVCVCVLAPDAANLVSVDFVGVDANTCALRRCPGRHPARVLRAMAHVLDHAATGKVFQQVDETFAHVVGRVFNLLVRDAWIELAVDEESTHQLRPSLQGADHQVDHALL